MGTADHSLAARACRVIAVDLAPELARKLRRTFGTNPRVEVVEADILRVAFPIEPFRAFGNVPFAVGTAILRRLLDKCQTPLTRADLLLQHEVAQKRALTVAQPVALPGMASVVGAHSRPSAPRRAFAPPPSVDAGMLRVTRRDPQLLPTRHRPAFIRMLRMGFRRGPQPVRRSLPGLTPAAWNHVAAERGLPFNAGPTELDVIDWVALYRLVKEA